MYAFYLEGHGKNIFPKSPKYVCINDFEKVLRIV